MFTASALNMGSLLAASSLGSTTPLTQQLLQLQQLGLVNPLLLEIDYADAARLIQSPSDSHHSHWSSRSDNGLKSRVAQILASSRNYDPVTQDDFPPLQVIMQLGTANVPIIIERHTYEEAREIFQGEDQLKDIDEMEIFLLNPAIEPMVFTLSTWNGVIHAISCCTTQPYAENTRIMTCNKDLKFDHDPSTSLKAVGPVLTLARLRFMQQRGYWQEQHSILTDIRPFILDGYRRHFTTPPAGTILDKWGISPSEARHMLANAPYLLVELPLEAPATVQA